MLFGRSSSIGEENHFALKFVVGTPFVKGIGGEDNGVAYITTTVVVVVVGGSWCMTDGGGIGEGGLHVHNLPQ